MPNVPSYTRNPEQINRRIITSMASLFLPPYSLLSFVPVIRTYISFLTFGFNSELSQDFGLQMSQFRKLISKLFKYEGWNFNSGNYLFTADTK